MKSLLLFFTILLSINSYSQEIYLFKKIKQKKMLKKIAVDSLVLYSDGSFYRRNHFQYHEIVDKIEKGKWSKKDNILTLYSSKKLNVFDEWISETNIEKFKIEKRTIISLSEKKRLKKIQ